MTTQIVDRSRILSHFIPTFRKTDNTWIPKNAIVVLSSIIQYGQGRYPQNYFITKDAIAMDVFHTGTPSRRQKEYITDAIEELYQYDDRFLKPVNGTRTRWEINGKYTLNIQEIYDYARVYSYELDTIAEHKHDNIPIYKAFYIQFLSLFYDDVKNKRRGCGYSIKKLAEKFDVAKQTIENRIDVLKHLGLINVLPPVKYDHDGRTYSISSTYYRPMEIEWAKNYVAYRLDHPYYEFNKNHEQSQS